MSVILYEKDEILAMLASSWYHGSIGSRDGKERIQRFAEMGNRIAVGNMLAYANTYDEHLPAVVVTAREVESALVRKTVETMTRGYRTLRGIRYNLIANNGEDFATPEILDDLVSMFSAVADRIMQRLAA